MPGLSEHLYYFLFSLLIISGNFAGFPGTKLRLKHFLKKSFEYHCAEPLFVVLFRIL